VGQAQTHPSVLAAGKREKRAQAKLRRHREFGGSTSRLIGPKAEREKFKAVAKEQGWEKAIEAMKKHERSNHVVSRGFIRLRGYRTDDEPVILADCDKGRAMLLPCDARVRWKAAIANDTNLAVLATPLVVLSGTMPADTNATVDELVPPGALPEILHGLKQSIVCVFPVIVAADGVEVVVDNGRKTVPALLRKQRPHNPRNAGEVGHEAGWNGDTPIRDARHPDERRARMPVLAVRKR